MRIEIEKEVKKKCIKKEKHFILLWNIMDQPQLGEFHLRQL